MKVSNSESTKSPVITAIVAQSLLDMLLDTGAEANCISEKFYLQKISKLSKYREKLESVDLVGPDGENLSVLAKLKLPFTIFGTKMEEEFYVVKGLKSDILLGFDSITKRGIDMLNSEFCAIYKGRRVKYKSPKVKESTTTNVNNIRNSKLPRTTYLLHACSDTRLYASCETMIDVRLGNFTKTNDKKTIFVDSHVTAVSQHKIYAARGIAHVQQAESAIVVANLGTATRHIRKGDILGVCTVIEDDTYQETSLPSEKHINSERLINNILKAGVHDTPSDTRPISHAELQAKIKAYNLPGDLQIGIEGLTHAQLTRLCKVLAKYVDLFATNPDNPGSVAPSVAEHSIDTGDAKPINQGPRRVSPDQRRIIKETIDKLLDAEIISPSKSPWASPVLLVPKKGGETRMCIDYRKLNAVTKKEIYALPRIDDVLDQLGGKYWFTTLDLASGYFQIPMSEPDKEKTAFITYDGQYQYNYMSFGLINAPSTFQRCMDTVLAGLKWQSVQIYLDDAIVASPTFDKHLEEVAAVLDRFKSAGLKLKSKKCHFCCQEVEYLGHLITKEGVRANPEKVAMIAEWKTPSTPRNLQSFLGLAGYYRRLIKDFATFEYPLRQAIMRANEDLNNRKGTWKLQCDEMEAFETLKKKLMDDPVITLPDFRGKSRFELHTDASDSGISAILTQISPDNKERVLQYASRMLTKPELKWHTQEKEALAIVWGCKKFRSYLIGAPFIVKTDHHSLKWLMQSEKGRLARWALALSEFEYVIHHRPGIKNPHADAGSRYPNNGPDDDWDPFPSCAEPMILSSESGQHKVTVQSIKLNEQTSKHNLLTIVQAAQANDDLFVKAHEAMQVGDKEEASEILKSYLYERGYKPTLQICENLLVRQAAGGVKQILIPREATEAHKFLLQTHHDLPMAGHFGRSRTYGQIKLNYYWPTMYKDVKKYIYTCDSCQTHKTAPPSTFASGLKPSIPSGPNIRVSVDLIGPLPESTEGHIYCAVMVDYFTKWPVAVPLFSKNQEEVADALYLNWYTEYGPPCELQTDQGKEFTNDLLARLNDRMQVEHRVTTPYHPQANGEVERFNGTIKKAIAIYAEKHPGTWNRYLNGLLFAYRTTLNPVTGFSPFYLQFGRLPRLPSEILYESKKEINHDVKQYGMLMTLHLHNAYEIVQKNIIKAAEHSKLKHDLKVKTYKQFAPGDKVMIFQPKTGSRENETKGTHLFKRKWLGPYDVIDIAHQNNKDVYIIKDKQTGREWTINVNKMKPYHTRNFLSDAPTIQKDAPHVVVETLDARIPTDARSEDAQMTDSIDGTFPHGIQHDAQRTAGEVELDFKHKDHHRHTTGVTVQESVRERERALAATEPEPTLDSLAEYEVDKVITHRKIQNKLHYLTTWKHTNMQTWEPAEHFYNPVTIEDYWNRPENVRNKPKRLNKPSRRSKRLRKAQSNRSPL